MNLISNSVAFRYNTLLDLQKQSIDLPTYTQICLYMYAQGEIYQTVLNSWIIIFLIIKIASNDILFIVIYTQKKHDYDLI